MSLTSHIVFLDAGSHDLRELKRAVDYAVEHNRHLRIEIQPERNGRPSEMKYKVGESGWTPPIRSHQPNGGYPMEVRSDRYVAHFQPEQWVNDQAVEVDPDGRTTTWDVTDHVQANSSYWFGVMARRDQSWETGVLDNDDVLKADPNAPQWVREWSGPFTITVQSA